METKSLKYWKIFAVIMIALNITLIVFLLLKPLGRPPLPRDGKAPGEYLVEKLKFTTQQETEFDKLREAHHESIMALQEEGRKLRKDYFDGLKSDTEINNDSLINKITANQKQIELTTFNHFKEVKKLCTPEQKVIFNSIIQEMLNRLQRPI